MSLGVFLKRFERQSVEISGETWAYYRTGAKTATPIVLLGGGQGDGSIFYRQFLALADSYDLISVSYPGIEQPETLVERLRDFVSALSLDRIHLVGASLGGYIAQMLTLRYPDEVGKLMLACSFADCAAEKSLFPSAEELRALPAQAIKAKTQSGIESLDTTHSNFSELRTALRHIVGELQSAENLKGRTLAILASKPLSRVNKPDSDIAIIDCADDPVIKPQTQQHLRGLYPSAQALRLNIGHHYPAITAPGAFSGLMRDHFQ